MPQRAKIVTVLVALFFSTAPFPSAQAQTAGAGLRPDVSDIVTVLGLKIQGWTDARIGRVRFDPSVSALTDGSGYEYAGSRRTGAAIIDMKQLSGDPEAYRIVVNYRFDDPIGRRAFVLVSATYALSKGLIYVSSAVATPDYPDIGRIVTLFAPVGDDQTPGQLVERPFAEILQSATDAALPAEFLASMPDSAVPMRMYVFNMLRAPNASSMGVAFSASGGGDLAKVTGAAKSNKNGFRVVIVEGNFNLGAPKDFDFEIVSETGDGAPGNFRMLRRYSTAAFKQGG